MVIKTFYIKASSYLDYGAQIGKQLRDQILEALNDKNVLRCVRFYETKKGREVVDDFMNQCQKSYSNYMDEIRGMADGAGVPFPTLFIYNIVWQLLDLVDNKEEPIALNDVLSPQPGKPDGAGCTDLHVRGEAINIWGHTEDLSASYGKDVFLVVAEVMRNDNPSELESYMAFCNPGMLAGVAWGYNRHGLCMSVNALAAKTAKAGIGCDFVVRSILSARTVDEAITLASVAGIAGGSSINIASIHEKGRRVNLETSHAGVAVFEIPCPTVYLHCNWYLHSKNVEEHPSKSSFHRTNRINALCAEHKPSSMRDVLEILSDDADKNYPVFRGPWALSEPQVRTVCTVLFDIDAERLFLFDEKPIAGDPKKVFCLSNIPQSGTN